MRVHSREQEEDVGRMTRVLLTTAAVPLPAFPHAAARGDGAHPAAAYGAFGVTFQSATSSRRRGET